MSEIYDILHFNFSHFRDSPKLTLLKTEILILNNKFVPDNVANIDPYTLYTASSIIVKELKLS